MTHWHACNMCAVYLDDVFVAKLSLQRHLSVRNYAGRDIYLSGTMLAETEECGVEKNGSHAGSL